ncbi:MAG: hypothetical protein HQL25_01935 [Candidatus Omnitrophica bacterium]|nr:hypothetical protein [Candidatus Omnitrophota bacterium]
MGERSYLEIIILLVPVFNIILWWRIWVRISRFLQRSHWWGLLMCVPVFNLIAIWTLAFSNTE